ncbi:hypothetical protein [Natrialba aegyptia]|nr:hypothetical protein [Natrialba aegyptia]
MTDPADVVEGFTHEIAGGVVAVTVEPIPGGKVKLTAEHNDEVLESGEYKRNVFSKPTPRGSFLNSVEESLESKSGVDASDIRRELKEWFAEMNELAKEEQEDLLPPEIQEILNGTQYPIEIYDGEPTTWKVTLEYAGRLRELEFTSSEMISDSGGALREKIANQFFELVEIQEEDWKAIRDRWQERTEVMHIADETANDAIAERVLEYISNNVMPVDDQDKLGNDVASAWYDSGNSAGCDDAPPDADILWVQDSFFVDQLENAGKQIEYKGQLVKDLISRGELHGKKSRRRWIGSSRAKYWPFDPDSLGVDPEDIAIDDPAHSEVEV